MTKRIILTNKETGQVLPEATELFATDYGYEVQFDATRNRNDFLASDWTAEYPEPPVEVPTKAGTIAIFRTGPRSAETLGWLANDGTWDLILPRGEYHSKVSRPIVTIESNGYNTPTEVIRYIREN